MSNWFMDAMETVHNAEINTYKGVWDMVSYPFGGGTNKEDNAYYRAAMQQANLPKKNLYGNYTGIGPTVSTATFNSAVVKPTATAIVKAGSAVGGVVGNMAEDTLSSSKFVQYGFFAIGAIVIMKLIR